MNFSQGAIKKVRPLRSNSKPPDRESARRELDAALGKSSQSTQHKKTNNTLVSSGADTPNLSPPPSPNRNQKPQPPTITLSPIQDFNNSSIHNLSFDSENMAALNTTTTIHAREAPEAPQPQRVPRRRHCSETDATTRAPTRDGFPPRLLKLTTINLQDSRQDSSQPPGCQGNPPPATPPGGACAESAQPPSTSDTEASATAADVTAASSGEQPLALVQGPAHMIDSSCQNNDVPATSSLDLPPGAGTLQEQATIIENSTPTTDANTNFSFQPAFKKKLFQRHYKSLLDTFPHLQRVSTLPRFNDKVLSVIVSAFRPGQEHALHHLNAQSLEAALAAFSAPTTSRKISNNRLVLEIPFSSSPHPLLAMTSLCGIPVTCRLALGPGLVHGFTPDDPSTVSLSDDALISFFSGASGARASRYRILTCTRARLQGVQGLKLIMASKVLPLKLTIGDTEYNLEPFVPAPMFCSSCQRLGHTSGRCSNRPRCTFCASAEHVAASCPVRDRPHLLRCSLCTGAHLPLSRECPAAQLERQVAHLHATTDLGLSDACLLVLREEAERRCSADVASGATEAANERELPEPPPSSASGAPAAAAGALPLPLRVPSPSPPSSLTRTASRRSRPRRRRVTPSTTYAAVVQSRFFPPPASQLRDPAPEALDTPPPPPGASLSSTAPPHPPRYPPPPPRCRATPSLQTARHRLIQRPPNWALLLYGTGPSQAPGPPHTIRLLCLLSRRMNFIHLQMTCFPY